MQPVNETVARHANIALCEQQQSVPGEVHAAGNMRLILCKLFLLVNLPGISSLTARALPLKFNLPLIRDLERMCFEPAFANLSSHV